MYIFQSVMIILQICFLFSQITGRYQLMAEASADSVPCFEDFHKNLAFSLASAVESYSQEFAALSTDIERFAYVWKLPCVQKFDLKSWKISSGKDNGKAVRFCRLHKTPTKNWSATCSSPPSFCRWKPAPKATRVTGQENFWRPWSHTTAHLS